MQEQAVLQSNGGRQQISQRRQALGSLGLLQSSSRYGTPSIFFNSSYSTCLVPEKIIGKMKEETPLSAQPNIEIWRLLLHPLSFDLVLHFPLHLSAVFNPYSFIHQN